MKKLFVESAIKVAQIKGHLEVCHWAEFEAIGPSGTKISVFLTHGGVDGTTTADEILRDRLQGNPNLLVVCCHQAAIAAVWGCKTLFDECSDELYIFWRLRGRPHLEIWDEAPDLWIDGITII